MATSYDQQGLGWLLLSHPVLARKLSILEG